MDLEKVKEKWKEDELRITEIVRKIKMHGFGANIPDYVSGFWEGVVYYHDHKRLEFWIKMKEDCQEILGKEKE